MNKKHILLITWLCLLLSSKGIPAPPDNTPRLVLPVGHTSEITGIRITSDLKFLISSSNDRTVKVTSLRGGATLVNFDLHTSAVNSIDLSKDERTAISASDDSFIYELNIKKGQSQRFFKLPYPVARAYYGSNDQYIFCYSESGRYHMLHRETGNILWNNEKYKYFIDAQISPDGRYIILNCDQFIEILSADNGKSLHRIHAHTRRITSLSCNDLSSLILSASNDSTARLWDLHTGKLLQTFSGHQDIIRNAAFSPDGKFIATASEDRSACVWNSKTGKLIQRIEGFDHWVEKVQFNHEGDYLIIESGGITGQASLHSCKFMSGTQLIPLDHSDENIAYWTLSPTGRSVVFGCLTGAVYACETHTGDFISDLSGLVRYNGPVYLNPSGRLMLTDGGTGLAHIWDIRQGKITQTLYDSLGIYNASMDAQGKWVLTHAFENHISLRDLHSGKVIHNFHAPGFVRFSMISNDNKYIIANTDNFKIYVWSTESGRLISEFACSATLFHLIYNAKNETLITAYFQNYGTGDIQLWDIKSGELIRYLDDRISGNQQNLMHLSKDGNYLLTGTYSPKQNIRIYSSDLRDTLYKGELPSTPSAVQFTHNSDQIFIASDQIVRIIDWKTNLILFELINPKPKSVSDFRTVAANPGSNNFVVASNDGRLRAYRMSQASAEMYFDDTLDSRANFVAFGPGDSFVIIGASDYSYRYVNLHDPSKKTTMITLNYDDYITLTGDGYYRATPNAAYRLYYVDDSLNIITFEQLDVRSNRPDMVLKTLDYEDTSVIRAYFHAYTKRMKKLGFRTENTTGNYVQPRVEILNRNSIPESVNSELLTLKLSCSDPVNFLQKLNIWVNDVPCFGSRGIPLQSRNSRNFDTAVTIELTAGFNRIECGIMNAAGLENYRIPMYVTCTPEKQATPRIHFIGLGIEKFRDSSYNLKYSVKDIRNLAETLGRRYGDTLTTDTLFNEQINESNLAHLQEKLALTSVNDKVIVAYSGHGLLSKNLDYYLSTYHVDFGHPESGGLPYESLEELIDNIPARQKLLLIDACHSGEVDKDEFMQNASVADSLGLIRGSRIVAVKKENQNLGLTNSFELMQNLFINVGKGTGATVISASAGTQFALERGDLKNGVFTYSILEAMNAYPTLTVYQLSYFVSQRVSELTRGMQQPTSRSETINHDWSIW